MGNSFIHKMRVRLLLILVSCLPATAVSALPAVENLRFTYDSVDGRPRCGTERLTFTYGGNSGEDTAWGLTIRRNGFVVNNTSVYPRPLTGPETLGSNVIGS